MIRNPRQDLLRIMQTALSAVHGHPRVATWLQKNPVSGPVWAVAIGKAAAAMVMGARDVLGNQLQRGLLVTKIGHLAGIDKELNGFDCYESGHPLPDATSLVAGQALLRLLEQNQPGTRLLFLLSGGASSLVEVLPKGMELEDLQRINAWLLAHEIPIGTINQVRKCVSCIKGGRLVQYLNGRETTVLIISDVIGDQPATIGSGLLAPDEVTDELPVDLPASIRTRLAAASSQISPGDTRFKLVTTSIIARLRDAQRAAMDCGQRLGYNAQLVEDYLHGDALKNGRDLARDLLEGPSGLRVWGGETAVRLPAKPGRGGRNQSLALAAAMELAGREQVWLLSVGTDGSDGPTGDAGALVDGGTLRRGVAKSLDPAHCLAAADAGSFLDASGDLVRTGPTGTNVMDLVIGLREQKEPKD